jgi:hypothetical protein
MEENTLKKRILRLDEEAKRTKRLRPIVPRLRKDLTKSAADPETPDRPLFCRYQGCIYEAKTKADIIDHNTNVHMKDVSYPCFHCDETFKRDRELNAHLLEAHGVHRKSRNRTNAWICHFEGCEEQFETRKLLWDHKNSQGHAMQSNR